MTQWITENWLTLLLVGGMLAMHLFGHGHGKKKRSARLRVDDDRSGADATTPDDKE